MSWAIPKGDICTYDTQNVRNTDINQYEPDYYLRYVCELKGETLFDAFYFSSPARREKTWRIIEKSSKSVVCENYNGYDEKLNDRTIVSVKPSNERIDLYI